MDPYWYRSFFDTDALDTWQRSRSSELTAAEVEYLANILAADPGQRLLDLACGNGRHAVGLAARGFAMTGVDIAEGNRARVERRATAAGVSVDLVIGDMAEAELGGGFAGAYLWGNSFGYLPPAETERWLGSVAGALLAGSRFVIDTSMIAESIFGELDRRTWVRIDERTRLLMESRYVARESRLETVYTTLRDDTVSGESTAQIWIYTCAELVRLLERNGFEVLDLHGSLEGDRFELGDEQLIVIAARR